MCRQIFRKTATADFTRKNKQKRNTGVSPLRCAAVEMTCSSAGYALNEMESMKSLDRRSGADREPVCPVSAAPLDIVGAPGVIEEIDVDAGFYVRRVE